MNDTTDETRRSRHEDYHVHVNSENLEFRRYGFHRKYLPWPLGRLSFDFEYFKPSRFATYFCCDIVSLTCSGFKSFGDQEWLSCVESESNTASKSGRDNSASQPVLS